MTDIKVGDCPHPIFERGLCNDDGEQPCLRCGAMVESGKVYEWPPNAPKSPYSHDLPKDGSMVHGCEKEAVNANGEELRRFYLFMHEINLHDSIIENGVQGCFKVWQHQQAVVDKRGSQIESLLIGSDHLRQMLKEEIQAKQELQKRVAAALAECDKFENCKPRNLTNKHFVTYVIRKALGADHESN